MFASLDRVAFYIADYPVMKYGIAMAVAMAVCVILLMQIRKIHYPEFSEDNLNDLALLIIISGVIGARLWYVLLNADYYFGNPFEIFMLHHGGISIQGAILGGITAGYFYTKKKNLNFLKLADLFAFVLPVGQAIGRWGNFFNSEAFGKPCNLPWKLYIAPEYRPIEYIDYDYFHPTFLYESIADICIFLILFFVLRKKFKGKDGTIFFSYLILYSVVRFFIEFMRTDSVLNIGNIPVAAVVCVIFALVGIFGLIKTLKNTPEK